MAFLISLLKSVSYYWLKNNQFERNPPVMVVASGFLKVLNRLIHRKCGKRRKPSRQPGCRGLVHGKKRPIAWRSMPGRQTSPTRNCDKPCAIDAVNGVAGDGAGGGIRSGSREYGEGAPLALLAKRTTSAEGLLLKERLAGRGRLKSRGERMRRRGCGAKGVVLSVWCEGRPGRARTLNFARRAAGGLAGIGSGVHPSSGRPSVATQALEQR